MKRDNRMVWRVIFTNKKHDHGWSLDLIAADEEQARELAMLHIKEQGYKLRICSAKELCKLNRYLGGIYLDNLVPFI